MRLPFGLKNGRIVTVEEVSSGKSCGALCPACLGPLLARKGDVLAHHFAHDGHHAGPGGKSPCTRGYPTAIRQMAAQTLSETEKLALPPLTARAVRRGHLTGQRRASRELVPAGTTLSIIQIQHNPSLSSGIQPAVLCELKGFGQLAIEFSLNGPLTPEAKQTYADLNLNCIEIDFSDIARPSSGWLPTAEDIRNLLYNDNTRRRWIFHRGLVSAENELNQKLASDIRELERAHRPKPKTENRDSKRQRHPSYTLKPKPRQRPLDPLPERTNIWVFCRPCHKTWEVDISSGRPTSVTCPSCAETVAI